ncbi:MAG TPA: hypothetical protein VGM14_09940 [Streptosporangiaceae bacterium]|jgi:hypothetical protein
MAATAAAATALAATATTVVAATALAASLSGTRPNPALTFAPGANGLMLGGGFPRRWCRERVADAVGQNVADGLPRVVRRTKLSVVGTGQGQVSAGRGAAEARLDD